MPGCCVCYTTDQGYLLPTLVSAIQARRNVSTTSADVIIFCFGVDASAERAFAFACAAENIRIIRVDESLIEGAGAMLARLFLARYVPAEYSHFLYIDGDTQVTGSLDPLVEFPVPADQFVAVSDPMTFEISGSGSHNEKIFDYFTSIGISREKAPHYFNTGVLRINREGWEQLGGDAWSFFRSRKATSRFPDQDALNIIGMEHCIPTSLAWNFPIFLRNSRVESRIMPRIYHYMGNPKPWQGCFLPWGAEVYQPYLDIVARYPELETYLSVMPAGKKFRYYLQQHYKKAMETFTWGMSAKRGRILNYEDGIAVSGRGLVF